MHYGDRGPAAPAKGSQWDERIRRAAELRQRFAFAAEILGFYGKILEFQKRVYEGVSRQASSAATATGVFLERLDLGLAAGFLPELLSLVEEAGTPKLAQEAKDLSAMDEGQRCGILRSFLTDDEAVSHRFFARAVLQPYAEWLAKSFPAQAKSSQELLCPVCGGRPQAAVLRPEGEGGKRFLLCCRCLAEWEFRRILCPVCGEEDHQRLPRYSAEDVEALRVEACDSCHFYLKSIDLTVDGRAVPLVDEVAAVPLDLWAAEHGYRKPEPNLMGF
ncbi:MAG TPA: formate dehydrogenase accessory protein FdhE [Candidatus Binatia bacterium]|nr:formate dehydrogenase accessory protein FdhE [Candidatus Binatia bacterium]